MKNLSQIDNVLFLGLDGGGTSCRAVLADSSGQEIGRGLSGPANPFQDLGLALDSIRQASEQALHEGGIDRAGRVPVVAGIGLAGVNLPTIYDVVADWQHGFDHVFLTTDLEIACIGAHSNRDGAVIVAGTGSSGCSRVDGRTQIIGAHGFPLGDFGGGAWTGLEAIKASLLAADGFIGKTRLSKIVSDFYGCSGEALVEKMAEAKPAEFARIAPLVFDLANDGDDRAVSIVRKGAAYLSDLARKLWETEPPAVAMLGGLRNLVLPWMDEDVAARMVEADSSAVTGSLLFARRKFTELLAAA